MPHLKPHQKKVGTEPDTSVYQVKSTPLWYCCNVTEELTLTDSSFGIYPHTIRSSNKKECKIKEDVFVSYKNVSWNVHENLAIYS